MPKKLRYAAQQTGHFGKKANANDASVARTGGADFAIDGRMRRRGVRVMSRISPRLVQHLDRTRHDLLLVPAYACKRCGDPTFRIENVSLDAMSVHQ